MERHEGNPLRDEGKPIGACRPTSPRMWVSHTSMSELQGDTCMPVARVRREWPWAKLFGLSS